LRYLGNRPADRGHGLAPRLDIEHTFAHAGREIDDLIADRDTDARGFTRPGATKHPEWKILNREISARIVC